MDEVRSYLLLVTSAAVLCAIVRTMFGGKSGTSAVIKMLCGLLLAFCLVSPLVNLEKIDFSVFVDEISDEAAQSTASGEIMAADAMRSIIRGRTEAYILDKATAIGLELEVEVLLNDASPPQPCAVVIRGTVPPYAKEVMSQYIADNLAIAREDQTWS